MSWEHLMTMYRELARSAVWLFKRKIKQYYIFFSEIMVASFSRMLALFISKPYPDQIHILNLLIEATEKHGNLLNTIYFLLRFVNTKLEDCRTDDNIFSIYTPPFDFSKQEKSFSLMNNHEASFTSVASGS